LAYPTHFSSRSRNSPYHTADKIVIKKTVFYYWIR